MEVSPYTVLESVTNNQGHLFFIHAAGGCRKTFLCNTITAEIRRRGQVALCVASSGIAALLLNGGRTSHSHFKIPLSIHEDSVASSISLQRKFIGTYQVLASQTEYALGSL